MSRDVTTGAIGATAVAPKFSYIIPNSNAFVLLLNFVGQKYISSNLPTYANHKFLNSGCI